MVERRRLHSRIRCMRSMGTWELNLLLGFVIFKHFAMNLSDQFSNSRLLGSALNGGDVKPDTPICLINRDASYANLFFQAVRQRLSLLERSFR